MSFFPGGLGCLGDGGYTTAEGIRSSAVANVALAKQVASAIIAIDNANRLIDNYKDQRDISQRTLEIAKAQQAQLSTVYWPREEAFLNEFSVPEPIEEVEVMGSRYAGRLASAVAFAFAGQLREARCNGRRYCSSANTKRIQDLMMARGVALANARVLGRNIAFAEYQARTDVNLSRRMQAVAIGRGLIAQAMSLFAAAGKGLAGAGQVLGGQLSSALEAFGDARENRANQLYRQSSGFRDAEVMPGAWPGMYDGYAPSGARMPGTVNGDIGTSFGLISGYDMMTNPQAGSTMTGDSTGWSTATEMTDSRSSQHEAQNLARIGNNDLARSGTAIFPLIGSPGTVAIDMDMFPLKYVDDRSEGYV